MKLRFPLYAKILLWFFLNVVFLSVVFYSFFRIQFRLGLDSLLMGRAGERLQAVSDVIVDELRTTSRAEWDDVLKRFSMAYQVQFLLFRPDGSQVAGETTSLPLQVLAKVVERRGPGEPRRLGPRAPLRPDSPNPLRREARPEPFREGRFERAGALPELPRPGPYPKFMVHTSSPSRYWVLVRIPAPEPERLRPPGLFLATVSDSIRGGGLFFDFVPWVIVGFAVLLVSLLFWLPLVRGITRSLSQVTRATEQIAQGSFEVRVDSKRTDELGVLSQAINCMAARLSGFVSGQKRFLGDIAHELCSPLARIQVALAILEERSDPKLKSYTEDVREEVEQISQLVNELLSFSKAGLRQKEIKLAPVNLSEIVQRVIDRGAPEPAQMEASIDSSIQVMAEPDLLFRALANVVRNAARYAGNSGPIVVSAVCAADQVTVRVADQGPGVPEETLVQIFDPFFRLEPSRSRETGGVGLGLAIVKTCVEACQGVVTAQNRRPSGLQVEITLKAAPVSRRSLG